MKDLCGAASTKCVASAARKMTSSPLWMVKRWDCERGYKRVGGGREVCRDQLTNVTSEECCV